MKALEELFGDFQGRLWPRNDEDKKLAAERGLDVSQVLTIDDMVKGDDIFFAATGVTTGDLLTGVQYFAEGARSESLVMRSRTGTIRRISTEHHWRKLQRITGETPPAGV